MVRPLRERESDAGIAPVITASPTASLSYSKPAIQTYSPSTGYSAVAGTNSSYSNMAPVGSFATYSGGNQNGVGGSWIQPQAAGPVAPPPAPEPPAPPVGGRTWYNGLDAAGKAAEDASWLGGDSDYTAQIGEYEKALKSFIDRIAAQKSMYEQDAKDATASADRNQAMSLDALGEDFGARGLSYSGLAIDSADKTNARFNEAKGNIGKVLARNNQDADNRQKDYETENRISMQNAQRSSLNRQAQRQALLDSQAGF